MRRLPRLVAALALAAAPLAALVATPAGAQTTGRITGTVTGEGGQPLPAAQVAVLNNRYGAVTNDEGRYTILDVGPGTYTVRVQRIGYRPTSQQVTVTAGEVATADFTLAPLPSSLTAQVVVGYTTQQRRDVSDATAGVTGEELRDQKVATVEEALRGRIPGVQIVASGEPGRMADIQIRGQNFLGGVSPLYVVDGMYLRQNPNLNPDDVESIEVLKDASAAAQYGAQAANGVIVIRTKRGRTGPSRVEVNSYYGYQEVPKRIDMMNTAQWAALTNEATQNAGLPPLAGAANPPNVNTNWQDAVFTRGSIQDHNLSVAGGSADANYLLSGGYLRQEGSIINTGFERFSFRVNSEARRGRLTLGENVALSSARKRNMTGFPLIDVLRMPPAIPVRDSSTTSGFGTGSPAIPTYGTNPVGLLTSRDNTNRSNQLIGSAFAQLGLLPGLSYKFNAGVNYEAYAERYFQPRGVLRYLGPLDPAQLTNRDNNTTSLLFENLLTYDRTFGGIHRLNAVAGITEQRQQLDALRAYREGFTNENLREIDAGQTTNQSNAGFLVESALRAFLARANYVLADRYLFTGSVRRDCSSRFGPQNRCGNFGAGSVGWVVSDEQFYRGVPLVGSRVNYLKARASYGELGNQDIGDYRFDAPIIQNVNYMFGGLILPGAAQLSLANPLIRWQANQEQNYGLDFGLLNDRLTLTTDYYISRSIQLLVEAPIPWSLGAAGSPTVNAGKVQNKGFELGLTHHLERGGFRLNSSANLTTISNKVLSLGNGGQPIMFNGVARTAVGHPIGSFYVFKTAGIFQSAAEVAAHGAQPDAQPGDIRYVDLNGDNRIDDNDRYYAGSAIPKLTYGFFFDGKSGPLDFGLNLRGSYGSKIFNVARWWTDRMDDLSNYRANLRPWTPTNTNTSTPRAVFGTAGAANAIYNSDRWIESGSFLRIQNVVLGYSLPSRVTDELRLRSGSPRIYLNVQNLYTFTHYSNWDPETLGFGDPLGRGIDDATIYPNVRTVSLGLDLRL